MLKRVNAKRSLDNNIFRFISISLECLNLQSTAYVAMSPAALAIQGPIARDVILCGTHLTK